MRSISPRTILEKHDQLRAGRIIISQKKHCNELLERSVVLILEHDETGSTGLILNKRSISFSATEPSSESIFYGGTYDTHRIGIIVKDPALTQRAVRISDDIYYSEKTDLLSGSDYHEKLRASKTVAFIGFTVWDAGQLEKEIENRFWRSGAFRIEDLTYTINHDLWQRKSLETGMFPSAISASSLLLN